MRVSMIQLRAGGRLLPPAERKRLVGTLATKRFIAADTWYKVLEFHLSSSYPGQFELFDPRVKECSAEGSVMVFSGLAQEGGAWVVQEWEVDVCPPREPQHFDSAWVKPARRYNPEDLPRKSRLADQADVTALKASQV